MAKFRADYTLTITGRKYLFVCGEILEGVIKVGDVLLLPWNSEVRMEGSIGAIEYVDKIEKKESDIALGIAYESEDEYQIWNSMNIGGGEEFEIRSRSREGT